MQFCIRDRTESNMFTANELSLTLNAILAASGQAPSGHWLQLCAPSGCCGRHWMRRLRQKLRNSSVWVTFMKCWLRCHISHFLCNLIPTWIEVAWANFDDASLSRRARLLRFGFTGTGQRLFCWIACLGSPSTSEV